MKKALSAGILLGAGVLASACIYEEEPAAPAPMVPASGRVLSPQQAVAMLSEARCDREARCNGIGPNAAFMNRQHCAQVMGQDLSANLSSCHYGVKDRAVQACALEISNAGCSPYINPLEWFDRVVTCRTQTMCLN
jgi:hypothetical protein